MTQTRRFVMQCVWGLVCCSNNYEKPRKLREACRRRGGGGGGRGRGRGAAGGCRGAGGGGGRRTLPRHVLSYQFFRTWTLSRQSHVRGGMIGIPLIEQFAMAAGSLNRSIGDDAWRGGCSGRLRGWGRCRTAAEAAANTRSLADHARLLGATA